MGLVNVTYYTTKIVFSALNVVAKVKYCFDYPKYRSSLKHNTSIGKNRDSDTCFILGNGPSLKKVNLELFENRDVITVNNMICVDAFETLKPKMHCILDRQVYEDLKLKIKEKLSTGDTKFILQRKAMQAFKNEENVFITYNTRVCNSKNIKYDLAKHSNSFINVVPYAIMCAMYAGYKKIVILGCDFSFFAARKDLHFYSVGENIKREQNLYQDLVGASIALKQFEYLYEYGLANGVEIVNATEDSLLDVLPQVDLDECL